MPGYVDLHCHWVANIDDGTRAPEAGIALLRGLHDLGFTVVMATPHMRPGMFDNDRAMLQGAYDRMRAPLAEAGAARPLPEVHLSSEHFFDEVVFERIRRGEACPYPSFDPKARKRGILIEFASDRFPMHAHNRFFDLHRAGYYPVLAHPERYAPVWADTAALEPVVGAGAHLLLDVCSLVGKYGRAAQRAAEKLLEEGAYAAACSDAHKPEDVDVVAKAIQRLEKLTGPDGATELLDHGPRRILHLPVPGDE